MAIFQLLVFPGLLFLLVYSLLMQSVCQRLSNPSQSFWQPLNDLLGLFGKEALTPANVSRPVFEALPVIALAAAVTAFYLVPLWNTHSIYPFAGDLFVFLFMLALSTLALFFPRGNLKSSYLFVNVFCCEAILFLSLLSAAVLAGSWSLSGISAFYAVNPLLILCNLPAIIALLISVGSRQKERAAALNAYSGRLLALCRLTVNAELVVISSVAAAVFVPVFPSGSVIGILVYLLKTLFIAVIITLVMRAFPRLPARAAIEYSRKLLLPLIVLQLLISILVKWLLL